MKYGNVSTFSLMIISLIVAIFGEYKSEMNKSNFLDNIMTKILEVMFRYDFPFNPDLDRSEKKEILELFIQSSNEVDKSFGFKIIQFINIPDTGLSELILIEIYNDNSSYFINELAKNTISSIHNKPWKDISIVNRQNTSKTYNNKFSLSQDRTSNNVSQECLNEVMKEERCCKLSGRLGDQYCNICGKSVKKEYIINN